MGGKPQKNTPADMRLKRNNPNAGKPKPQSAAAAQPTAILPPMIPVQPKAPPKKSK